MQKPFFKSKLFKLPNHKRFDFSARYYDQDKERMDQKRASIAKQLNKDVLESKIEREERIREQFKARTNSYSSSQNSSFWSNIRLLVIFGILMIGFYYIYLHLDEVLIALTKSRK